ncbi:hypothetical protein HYC85_030694 [Camellia sinensis]|uniref:Uncharacterized protein n=1 Tax=Camellia sinensis TaxID=4442 RepID=A0A7J7G1E6_CAMSI|nr:hypothetical protein HYC85_030694 [Camellia sinensis]
MMPRIHFRNIGQQFIHAENDISEKRSSYIIQKIFIIKHSFAKLLLTDNRWLQIDG